MSEQEIQKESNETAEPKKTGKVYGWAWVIGVIVIIAIIGSGKKEINPEQQLQQGQTQLQEEVKKEEPKKAIQENETKIESDFKITVEELYSMYAQANKDSSVWKKYNGKIVEITGMVTKAEDAVEVFKNSLAYSAWVKRYGETIPSFVQSQIDEGRRYYIIFCLIGGEDDGCPIWAYSTSPQLINGIKNGWKVTVVGQWKWNEGTASDLMNSEIKKIY